jgi:formyltetrahydrofolate deformylase
VIDLANRARMLISCADRSGIVAAVSRFLQESGANLVDSNQHTTDPDAGMFFMRVVFDLPGLDAKIAELEKNFAGTVAQKFGMTFRFERANRRKRIALFVSKEDHCLLELLWQWKSGDLNGDIVLVISNHPTLADLVKPYGIAFDHLPVDKNSRDAAEQKQFALLEKHAIDLVVLARYMQIVSGAFVERYRGRVINIHHSFLPAFIGASPYAQAYARGVKLIGATAHYVTEDLDAGPIIEQDVHRVGHRDEIEDLKRIGRHVERMVLARAVRWHLDDRVLVHGNKTVVFS